MYIKPVSNDFVVPVMNFHVFRLPAGGKYGVGEITQTQLENYYVTPDDAMSGVQGRKLSFEEAIQRFIV